MGRAAIVLAVAILLAPPLARAQRFRSTAEAVRVDTLVLDGRKPVGGLTAADFDLRDSGVPQEVEDTQILEVPFSMMLALDASSSMQPGRRRLQDAARAAVEALQPHDRAALLTFSEFVSTPTAWSAPRQTVIDAIGKLYSDGATSLIDAASVAILQRDPEAGRRNLAIIFTDGSDTSSWLPDDAAIDLASRSDVVVYCVAIDQERPTNRRPLQYRSGIRLSRRQPVMRGQDFLRDLASRTGGDHLSADFGNLEKTFRKIVSDFRSRYVLTYTPHGVPASGWHPIEVRVKGKGYKISARRGYQR
jgi:VWFA-related protein